MEDCGLWIEKCQYDSIPVRLYPITPCPPDNGGTECDVKILKRGALFLQNSRISERNFFARKYRKIRHFTHFRLNILIIKGLSRFSLRILVLEAKKYPVILQRRHFCTLTEALLGFNGASVALQKWLKRTLKVALLKANKR